MHLQSKQYLPQDERFLVLSIDTCSFSALPPSLPHKPDIRECPSIHWTCWKDGSRFGIHCIDFSNEFLLVETVFHLFIMSVSWIHHVRRSFGFEIGLNYAFWIRFTYSLFSFSFTQTFIANAVSLNAAFFFHVDFNHLRISFIMCFLWIYLRSKSEIQLHLLKPIMLTSLNVNFITMHFETITKIIHTILTLKMTWWRKCISGYSP